MRRILLLLICCFILLCAGCSQCENSKEKVSGTAPAVADGEVGSGGAVSDAPVTAARVMTGEVVKGKKEKNKKKEKKTVRIVTDPTGTKRNLKLGKVNVQNAEVGFCGSNPTSDYLQTYEGHCYYLRSDGSRKYTIYRDRGYKVGGFKIQDGYVGCFAKYGSVFYAIIMNEYIYKEKEDWEDEEHNKVGTHSKLVYIDLKKGCVVPLYDTDKAFRFSFYQNSLFYYKYEASGTGILTKCDLGKVQPETSLPTPSSTAEYSQPSAILVDGTLYYGIQKKNSVTLFSMDLDSAEQKQIFYYKFKKDAVAQGNDERNLILGIDDDYIYSKNFIIPLSGGKMKRLSGNVSKLCSNKKYIFYVDEKFKLHRITKKTGENIILCGMKVTNVSCTEKYIYVIGYDKKYEKALLSELDKYNDKDNDENDDYGIEEVTIQERDNFHSFDFYCMDPDGNQRKKIWTGRGGKDEMLGRIQLVLEGKSE